MLAKRCSRVPQIQRRWMSLVQTTRCLQTCKRVCVVRVCAVRVCVCVHVKRGRRRSTSTAWLWSDIDTLVLRCQHTCMVVLARWCVCLSSDVSDEFMSSSDSCSRETSSDDPEGGGSRRRDRKLFGREGMNLTFECIVNIHLRKNLLSFFFKEERKSTSAAVGCILREQWGREALTVGVVADFCIEEDGGLLLGLLGQFNSHVHVLNPLPHLHFRTAIPDRTTFMCIYSIERRSN